MIFFGFWNHRQIRRFSHANKRRGYKNTPRREKTLVFSPGSVLYSIQLLNNLGGVGNDHRVNLIGCDTRIQ